MIGPLHSKKRCSAVSRRECLTSKQGCPRTHLSARSTKPTPSSPDFVIRLLESCADGCRCARAVDTSATQNVADEGGCLRRPFRIWSQEVHRGRIATRADYCEAQLRLSGSRIRAWRRSVRVICGPLIRRQRASHLARRVLASRLGSLEEIVDDGRTDLHFACGDASDLCSKLEWAGAHKQGIQSLGRQARAEFLAKYTAERNYNGLMDSYRRTKEISRTAEETAASAFLPIKEIGSALRGSSCERSRPYSDEKRIGTGGTSLS